MSYRLRRGGTGGDRHPKYRHSYFDTREEAEAHQEKIRGMYGWLDAYTAEKWEPLTIEQSVEPACDGDWDCECHETTWVDVEAMPIDWQARAEAAEAAVARVEALCQDTDGNWLDPEDECNNVGGILQALRGEHTKQLGGTLTGEFADVCSCGKSYWPCDSLDGGA